MARVRTKHTDNYTVIPNAIVTDRRITGLPAMILIYALSKPTTHRITVQTMQDEGYGGADRVSAAFKALELAGYLIRRTGNIEKGYEGAGQWNTTNTFYDVSQLNSMSYTARPLKKRARKTAAPVIPTEALAPLALDLDAPF